jgi:hypothetical protein
LLLGRAVSDVGGEGVGIPATPIHLPGRGVHDAGHIVGVPIPRTVHAPGQRFSMPHAALRAGYLDSRAAPGACLIAGNEVSCASRLAHATSDAQRHRPDVDQCNCSRNRWGCLRDGNQWSESSRAWISS